MVSTHLRNRNDLELIAERQSFCVTFSMSVSLWLLTLPDYFANVYSQNSLDCNFHDIKSTGSVKCLATFVVGAFFSWLSKSMRICMDSHLVSFIQ